MDSQEPKLLMQYPWPDKEGESQAQLAARLTKAAEQIAVGARYRHYKQLTYKVLALALREEDNEPCVIYQAEYGDKIRWVRPVKAGLKKLPLKARE